MGVEIVLMPLCHSVSKDLLRLGVKLLYLGCELVVNDVEFLSEYRIIFGEISVLESVTDGHLEIIINGFVICGKAAAFEHLDHGFRKAGVSI
jgi:hypothetical protein